MVTWEIVASKVMKVGMKSSVFEVEVVAIYEGLKWVTAFSYQNIEVKSDSLLAVQSLKRPHDNQLEIGFVLDECHGTISSNRGLSIYLFC